MTIAVISYLSYSKACIGKESLYLAAGILDPNKIQHNSISITETVQFIGGEELQPDTSYDLRVWGENDHPDVSGPHIQTSADTLCKFVSVYVYLSLYLHFKHCNM